MVSWEGEDTGEIGETSGESVLRRRTRGSILFLCCGQALGNIL
jgi:hypothetical protein